MGRAAFQPLLAAALVRLGSRRAVVVHGDDGLDEVTLATSTTVIDTAEGQLRHFRWTPADFGLRRASLADLQVSGPEASAAIIRAVLQGRGGTARDIVVANAAAARMDGRRLPNAGRVRLASGRGDCRGGRRRTPGPPGGTQPSPLARGQRPARKLGVLAGDADCGILFNRVRHRSVDRGEVSRRISGAYNATTWRGG